ncbi:hypothetical protein Ahy_B09g099761 [Arachis hypogaea]|uniref:CCHC-type domain-containing protein n=1 Tax=Arachis hypogaea TaxID=3818 RepID=A0A444XUT4_ARAHY|nr:hypothetical protein Ahy_B09g099761 [Arachis hypogaea]
MPCMHAISVIQEKNDKRPEEYCHEWLAMEEYRRTYQYNVNPVKGQELWEKNGSPAPVPPPIKSKPRRPTTKRRKDKAEGPTGTKTKMKRKYNPNWCMYCGEVGHNKRTCSKKKQDNAQEKARLMQLQLAIVPPPQGAHGPEANDVADTQPIQTLPTVPSTVPDEQTEILVSQDAQLLLTQQSHTSTNATQTRVRGRPPKLHVAKAKAKENASPKPVTLGPVVVSAETIKGSSSATAKKLASFMTFVPTPGFIPSRKKKDME